MNWTDLICDGWNCDARNNSKRNKLKMDKPPSQWWLSPTVCKTTVNL